MQRQYSLVWGLNWAIESRVVTLPTFSENWSIEAPYVIANLRSADDLSGWGKDMEEEVNATANRACHPTNNNARPTEESHIRSCSSWISKYREIIAFLPAIYAAHYSYPLNTERSHA
jgi:hypothetical protein